MKLTIGLMLLAGTLANAGVIRVATYPVRHPHKTVRKTVHVAKKIIW